MKKRNKAQQKPIMALSPLLFKNLIHYLLSEDVVNRSFLHKLTDFFELVNTKHYEEDGDLEIYYRVITRILNIYLVDNIKHPDLILEQIISSSKDGEEVHEFLEGLIDELSEEPSLDNTTAIYIENEIIDRLNYITIVPVVDSMSLTLSQLEHNDFTTYSEIISKINLVSTEMTKSITAKSTMSVTLPDVTFNDTSDFKGIVSKARKYLNDEKRIIKTGIKRLNKFLNGGFQPGRVYVVNGITGGWKSGLLLSAAMWACRYNDSIICNDRTKSPAVMYITQENDVEETFDRIFSYIDGVDEKGKIRPDDELFELLQDFKLLGSKWTLIVKYRPKNSINTIDIDNLISEVEAEGELEVKMLVHDYIKRLKPNLPVGDLRIDLGECVNDLSILAKQRKIPIVTGNQLNREAYRALNETSTKNGKTGVKMDQGKKLDGSMISESQLVLENADLAFAINREQTPDGQMYLTIKHFKDRSAREVQSLDDYFAHPFDGTNGMRLHEDALLDHSVSINQIEDKFGHVTLDAEVFEDDEPEVKKPKTTKSLSDAMKI